MEIFISSDGGTTWLGSDCLYDIAHAIDILQNNYIPRGLCGCWLTCAEALKTKPDALIGQIVGTGMDVCEIIEGDKECPYYVQYR